MKFSNPISHSTLLAALLCATAAQADVTAEQVWQDWKDYYAGLGQPMTAASEAMEGDTLVVKDVKLSSKLPTASTEGAIPEIRLKEMGDGTVQITLSNEIPITLTETPEKGDPVTMKLLVTQKDMQTLVSGDPDAMVYDVTAPEVVVAMDEVSADGKAAPLKLQVKLTGGKSKTTSQKAEMRTFASDMSLDSVDLTVTGAEPETTNTFTMNATLSGLTAKGTGSVPLAVAPGDLNAMVQAGFAVDSALSYASAKSHVEGTSTDGNFVSDTSAAAGTINVKISKDGIAYGGDSAQVALALSGSTMPFPIEATIGSTAFNLAMPLSKSDTGQPAAFLMKVVDLNISDALWGMIDPQSQLPHDAGSLIVDVTGSVRPLIDLFDPKQAEALAAPSEDPAAPKSPFEVSDAKLNQLQLKVAGAELTGTGEATFDNTSAPPKPLGAIKLNLTGANALMDKLVAMGYLPQEQSMGARMMMGMFAVPTGDDAMTSKIEFKEDGIYANGQRIQ